MNTHRDGKVDGASIVKVVAVIICLLFSFERQAGVHHQPPTINYLRSKIICVVYGDANRTVTSSVSSNAQLWLQQIEHDSSQ